MAVNEPNTTNDAIYADIMIKSQSLTVCDSQGIYKYSILGISGSQVCFEAIVSNAECKDWFANPKSGCFTNLFPVSIFMGKKEGDLVELRTENQLFIVKCSQTKSSSTSFEDQLYTLSASFGGVNEMPDNDLMTEKLQNSMIVQNHQQYAKSIGHPVIEPKNFLYAQDYIKQCEQDQK